MAGKKAKPRKTTKKINIENLKPSDVLCPICRTILIEPVTLSCNHAFCKLCFEGTMENANLVCPLCRVRVGSWFRKAKKEGKLVDESLWEAIQSQYPTEVQNRYHGIDNVMEADVPVIVVATPGEIRKEYEQQRQQELEEQKKIREAEEKASAPLIKKLRDEEEQRKMEEEEKLRLDAALARKLAEDLEKPSTSKFTPKKVILEKKKIDSGKKSGPMDKFVRTEETKPNRLSFNKSEERRKLYKGERRRISITPNPAADFATKEYTCHVLNAESHPTNIINPYSIFNKRSSYNKLSHSGGMHTVQKKVRQARKIIEERKSICKSGYKSSGSGSEDAIDLECKFYFKPIDTQKRHHLPGTIPLKIPCLRGTQASTVYTGPPAGKIINLQLGTVISAFARFSMALQQNSPSHEVIEDETSGPRSSSPKRLKRKISLDDSPIRRKGRRQIYTKKNFQCVNTGKTVSSPLYGFDSEPSRVVNNSPFYGFNTLEIQKSNKERDTIKKLISKQELSRIDDNCVVSTERFYKSFKTYSRYQNRHSEESQGTSEEPLKLEISKTPKNGINMSQAIKSKLAELRSSVDGPSESYQPKNNTDFNRNIPKMTFKSSRNSFTNVRNIKGNLNSNSARTSLKNFKNSVEGPRNKSEKQNSCFNNGEKLDSKICDDIDTFLVNVYRDNKKLESSSNDVDTLPASIKNNKGRHLLVNSQNEAVVNDTNGNFKSETSPRKTTNCTNMDTDSKTIRTSSEVVEYKNRNNNDTQKDLNTCSSPINAGLNGTWKMRQRNGSPRKTQNNLRKRDVNFKNAYATSLVTDRISPVLDTMLKSAVPANLDTAPKSTKFDDTSAYPVNKACHAKTRNAGIVDIYAKITDTNSKITDTNSKIMDTNSKMTAAKSKITDTKSKIMDTSSKMTDTKSKITDTNSKITDTFSKTKSSPTKSKNAVKKLKLSPARAKLNNNIELHSEVDIDQRQIQEELDFEMAKKLQARFDAIQMPSRTRRGTKRQITLDEMLLV